MVIDFHSHTFFSDGLLLLAAILILIPASAGLAQLTDEDISRTIEAARNALALIG